MSGTKFKSTWWQRTQQAVLIAAHVTGLLVIAAVVIYFAQQRSMRQEIDATKTRAYSLSPQTRQLLGSLEGDWKIALVMVEDEADRALRRQTEEVLRRFTEASPKLTVLRLDPSDPRSVRGLEALIADLRGIYGDLVAQYDAALDAGLAAFDELHLFSQQQAGVLQQLAQTLPAESPLYEALASRAQMLVLWSQQADSVREEVIKARRIDDRRPLPDYETARSILAGTLGHWAQELDDVTRMFEQWPHTPLPPAEVRDVIADSGRRFERLARRLVEVADPLRHLPPLELSDIARALQSGEAAIIAGPSRAAVVSSEALFPKSNVQQVAGGGVTFDRRFRGEQLIASTIRSLLTEHMPMVVFVHAEARSLLAPEERNVDLAGVASNLKAARFDVREWIVHRTERPKPADGQPVVWVPIPPPQRQGRDPSQEEQLLTDTVKQLIDEGEPVLLSVYPSLRHRLRLPDAWADLALPFHLRVDTSAVLYEAVAVGEDERAIERGQTLTSYPLDHPISRAVEGQRLLLRAAGGDRAGRGRSGRRVARGPGPGGARRRALARIALERAGRTDRAAAGRTPVERAAGHCGGRRASESG